MDPRRNAPACERNRDPILAVLTEVLPREGRLLEVASGTGQHAAYFAPSFPSLRWQPTEYDGGALASIDAWAAASGAANIEPALVLDVTAEPWPFGTLDAVFNANMIHISPWRTCEALMAGCGRHLRSGGRLVVYGPYKIGGAHTAPSNVDFEAWLKGQDANWGVRDLEAVEDVARAAGLLLQRRVEMPANNQTLVFERA